MSAKPGRTGPGVQEYLSSVTLAQLIERAMPQPENLPDYPCGI